MGGKQSKDVSSPAGAMMEPEVQSQQQYIADPADWPWVWAIRETSVLSCTRSASSDDGGSLSSEEKNEIVKLEGGRLIDWKRKRRELPVAISDSLFIGSVVSVSNVERLQELGVNNVLNMAGRMAFSKTAIRAFEANGIRRHRISAQDEPHYPLLANHWEEAELFLRERTGVDKNGEAQKCVVNCVAGMNRSGLICAAFYMISTQTTVLETVHHLRQARGDVALQNGGFQEQLVALARQHGLLGPPPGSPGSFVPDRKAPSPPSVDEQGFDWRISTRPPPAPFTTPLDNLATS